MSAKTVVSGNFDKHQALIHTPLKEVHPTLVFIELRAAYDVGLLLTSYSQVFAGCEVPQHNARFPELEPRRDFDPSRLHLCGRGHWDVTDFLCVVNLRPFAFVDNQQPVKSGTVLKWLQSLLCFGTFKASYFIEMKLKLPAGQDLCDLVVG